MKEAYKIVAGLEEFQSVREQFADLMNYIQSSEALQKEHGEIEDKLWEGGMELLRLMLQGHVDYRSGKEIKQEGIQGSDRVIRTHCRKGRTRHLMSIFGEVQIPRMVYSARGNSSLFPLDAELNLGPDKYSHGLQRRIAEEVAKGSFEEAVLAVEKATGGKVPKRQAEKVSVRISKDFEAFYAGRMEVDHESTEDLLVISLDGKGIVMRHEDLREQTRKAAERANGKSKARLGKGEKRNRKRMATVAAVYTVKRYYRSAEEIMGDEERPKRPKIRNKRIWASVERDLASVIQEAFQEAQRRDPEHRRQWVVLVDGHQDQLDRIRACIRRYKGDVTLVIDFIHVLEYLWKAAYCFHKDGSEQAEQWVLKRALHILKGKVSDVAAGMRRSATLRELPADKRKAVDKCADYLLKYRDMACYDRCLEKGLPIATGVIEGACRHLIKDRLDITGARWRLAGAEAILKLRALRSSGDFEAYWEFHKAKELERNHIAMYESLPLKVAA